MAAIVNATNTIQEGAVAPVAGDVVDGINDANNRISSFTYTDRGGSEATVEFTNSQEVTVETQYGTLTIDRSGAYSYQQDESLEDVNGLSEDEPLDDVITYTGTAGSGTLTVTIDGDNDPVTAVDDDLGATEDTDANYTAASITGNDPDADGDALTVTSVGNAANGSVVLNLDGSVTFTPDADYNGPASFEYTVSDGISSDTGVVNITVDAVNDVPVANDDTVDATEQTPADYAAGDLIGNDTDVEGDVLSITSVANAVNGSVILNMDGSVTFTPDDGYIGAASFDYTVSDGTDSDTATVNVNVESLPTSTIDGTPDPDTINAPDGSLVHYVIHGLESSDVLTGGAVHDELHGGEGDDELLGGGGSDDLDGGAGNDVLRGGSGNDNLNGGTGDDQLLALAGSDTSAGAEGNDTYHVNDAGDVVTEHAGEGTDRVVSTISYTLGDNVENLTLFGSSDIDGTGNELNNIINGNSGNNLLEGGDGSDTLRGRNGDDVLVGGGGGDLMIGGSGADSFELDTGDSGTGAGTVDRILMFSRGDGDQVDLSGWDADTTEDGHQSFTFIGDSAFSGAAGELRAFTNLNGTDVVLGDTDGDKVADFKIFVSSADSPLIASDFNFTG